MPTFWFHQAGSDDFLMNMFANKEESRITVLCSLLVALCQSQFHNTRPVTHKLSGVSCSVRIRIKVPMCSTLLSVKFEEQCMNSSHSD
jgi:hypothetical protein